MNRTETPGPPPPPTTSPGMWNSSRLTGWTTATMAEVPGGLISVVRTKMPPAAGPPAPESGAGLDRPQHHLEWAGLSARSERSAAAVLLVLAAANMLWAAIRNTAVADELAAHIPAGYLYWISGQFGGGIDNFPLAQLWIALPVRLLGLDYQLFTEQHLLLFRQFEIHLLDLLICRTFLAITSFCTSLAPP